MRITRFAWHARGLPHHVTAIVLGLVITAAAAHGAPAPFSTFLAENVSVMTIGHDSSGNIFVVGTMSPSPIPGHATDIIAVRLDSNATKIDYFEFVPAGSGVNTLGAAAVDSQGDTYITGCTSSLDFPATSGGPVLRGQCLPFLIKLSPLGTVLCAALFAGVSANPQAIALDTAGNSVVTGSADTGYPVTAGAVAIDNQLNLFVTKLDASGSKMLFSAVGVGGSRIALGPGGDVFVAGTTTSLSYPTTPGAFQTTFSPSYVCEAGAHSCPLAPEQYVTRLSSDGTKLTYSTFMTGIGGTYNFGLAVDSAGSAYVTGSSSSGDYPYTVTAGGFRGFFLSKLDATGTRLSWSVMQGGCVLGLDASENPVTSVWNGGTYDGIPLTCITSEPTAPGAAVQQFNGQNGTLAATRVLISSGLGPQAIALEPDGRVLIGGHSQSTDVPLSPGVVFAEASAQRTASGAFLAAVDLSQPPGALGCVLDAASLTLVGPVAPGSFFRSLEVALARKRKSRGSPQIRPRHLRCWPVFR